MSTILSVLTLLLLTLGLALHGAYLESKIDPPCGFSDKCDARTESAMSRFFARKWKARIPVKAGKMERL
jgi:hypothetical protein